MYEGIEDLSSRMSGWLKLAKRSATRLAVLLQWWIVQVSKFASSCIMHCQVGMRSKVTVVDYCTFVTMARQSALICTACASISLTWKSLLCKARSFASIGCLAGAFTVYAIISFTKESRMRPPIPALAVDPSNDPLSLSHPGPPPVWGCCPIAPWACVHNRQSPFK